MCAEVSGRDTISYGKDTEVTAYHVGRKQSNITKAR